MEKFKHILKRFWPYVFVFLFCVKCTQNCSKQGVILKQETEITHLDSIIDAQSSQIYRDSLEKISKDSQIHTLQESLRIFDKAYDAQLKQQEAAAKNASAVDRLTKQVADIDRKLSVDNEQ